MKSLKFALFAAASVAGLQMAFAERPQKFFGTTYYGVTDGGGSFRWTKTAPSFFLYHCDPDYHVYCTIVTLGVSPVNGVKPTNVVVIRYGLYVENDSPTP